MGLPGAAVTPRTAHFSINREFRRSLQIVAAENADSVQRLQPWRAFRMRKRRHEIETLDYRAIVWPRNADNFRVTLGRLWQQIFIGWNQVREFHPFPVR